MRLIALIVAVGALACWARAEDVPPNPQPAERVTLSNGERAIRVSRLVHAPAETVYRVWATGDGFTEVFERPASIDATPGGEFFVQWVPTAPEGQRGSETCEVLACLPDRMISFTWNAPPQFGELREQHTRIVVEFDDVGPDQTRMTLTHLGWPDGDDWDEVYEYFANAWPWVCSTVADHYAEGAPGEWDTIAYCYLFVEFSRPDLMETMTPEEGRIMGEHFAYLQRLTREGTVILAGPCTDIEQPDHGPGIVVLYADSEEKAREIMENDPAVKHGIFKAELHPFAVSLLRERDLAGR